MHETKLRITAAIEMELWKLDRSKRALANAIGWHYPQVIRITNGTNYTIDNLLRVLDELDLRITIEKKPILEDERHEQRTRTREAAEADHREQR